MSPGEPEQQQGLGCLTLAGIFFFICWSIETVSLVTHPPIDFINLSIQATLFALCLFLYSPWGRPLLWKSPLVAKSPLLIASFFSAYLLLKQYPLNSPQAIFSLFTGLVYLFSLSPWFKYILRWFPPFLIMLIIVWGILTTYPLVTHRPVDSLKLFSTLVIFISMLAFLLLLPRFFRRMSKSLNETNKIHFSLGRTHLPQEETATPVVDVHFLGVSLQILRSGKFTKITLSTD